MPAAAVSWERPKCSTGAICASRSAPTPDTVNGIRSRLRPCSAWADVAAPERTTFARSDCGSFTFDRRAGAACGALCRSLYMPAAGVTPAIVEGPRLRP